MQAIIYDVIGYEVKPLFITEDELADYNNGTSNEPQEPQTSTSTIEDNDGGKNNLIFITHSIHLLLVQGTASHAASLAVAEAPAEALFIYGA